MANPEQTNDNALSIGVADLENAIRVIDYACEQGAFKGWQVIEQVATVRGKLAAFVQSATPPNDSTAEVDTNTSTKQKKQKQKTVK